MELPIVIPRSATTGKTHLEAAAKRLIGITYTHNYNLLKLFTEKAYTASEITDKHLKICETVRLLFLADNECFVLDNDGGDLCTEYPPTMYIPSRQVDTSLSSDEERRRLKTVVLERETHDMVAPVYTGSVFLEDEDLEHNYFEVAPPGIMERLHTKEYGLDWLCTAKPYRILLETAMYFRSRKRFPVPVILYRDRLVTRSATVPVTAEMLARYGSDLATSYFASWNYFGPDATDKGTTFDLETIMNAGRADRSVLTIFRIKSIFDLMVEKGKVKYNLQVSSSEKEGTDYADFAINVVPYPGCEFFATFKEEYYNSEKIFFDWKQPFVDATLRLATARSKCIQKSWDYESWPLHHLTRVYLMVMLTQLKCSTDGILVHCISGWDRTPLFISLLRMSLWADGEIHQSLSPMQMLYLTLAYDWFLFGHNLKDRQEKGEQVMVFCFSFLKYIKGNNFSINNDETFGQLRDYVASETSTAQSQDSDLMHAMDEDLDSWDTRTTSPCLSTPEVTPEQLPGQPREGVPIPGSTPKSSRPLLIGNSSPNSYGCDDENNLDPDQVKRRRTRKRHDRLSKIRRLFFYLAEDIGIINPVTPEPTYFYTKIAELKKYMAG